MNFTDLIAKLQKEFDIQVILQDTQEPIQSVRLLDGKEKNFAKNTLYMGPLGKGPLPPQAIITGRLPNSEAGKNLAKLKGKQLFSAYNTCRSLLKRGPEETLIKELQDLSLRTPDLETFIEATSSLLNNPLILMDQDYKIVAYSKQFNIQDPLWAKVVDRGYCRYPLIKASEGSAPYKLAQASREAYLGEMCHHTPGPKIYSKVYSQGAYWGAILLLEQSRPISYEDYKILPKLSQFLEHMISRLKLQPKVERAKGDKAFYRLLVGASLEDLDLDKTTIQAKGQYVILALKSLEKDGLKADYFTSIRTYFPTAHFAKLEGKYVFLLPLGSGEALPKEAMTYFLDLAHKDKLAFGISNPFQDLSHVVNFYDQASYALNFPLNSSIKPYARASLGKLLQDYDSLAKEPISWQDYIHPALIQLKAYDKKHNSSLYETLAIYLKQSANVKETAAALFLHRNSVKYRLDQIIDLCQLDLENSDLRFHLRLSYYILDCLDQGLIQ